ncbi:MAG: MoaD/ThiS family protein [Caldilineae bacterium]|nr:MAG: MoaD/ThiS family protein [Caldilineae bacterium]
MTTVYIPTPLRRLTANQSKVEIQGETLGAVLKALGETYPGVEERIFDDRGQVKRFINVFVNDDEMRTLQGLDTPVRPEDKISIVPAMAGGS